VTNNQQDREAVARIIDPAAWSEREGFIRRQMRDWQYNADVVVEKSLAAADAIIALLTSDTERASPGAAEMAAFGASDAACYLYPGEDQQAERAAFCAGAAHGASALQALAPTNPGAAEAMREAAAKVCRVLREGAKLSEPSTLMTIAMHEAVLSAFSLCENTIRNLPAPTPEQPAQASEVERLPRLTRAMIAAACAGHFGKRATDQLGIEGIDLTADGRNWTFEQGFRRMWRGIAKHLATHPSTGERA